MYFVIYFYWYRNENFFSFFIKSCKTLVRVNEIPFFLFFFVVNSRLICFCIVEPPPKRNFLRENVLKVKESSSKHGKINEIVSNKQKLNLLKKNQRGKSLETLKNNGNDDFTIVSQDSTTQYTCLCSHNCRPCSRTSQLVDQSSQTMDVTSEIFLKDAIIRYPSSYTESLKSSEYINGNNSERCLDDQNDGDSKRKSFISNLNEFLETSLIKRNNKETCRSESCMEQPINSPSICYIKTPESPKLRKFSNTNTINQYNDVANLIANTNELTIEPPKTSSSLESANSNHSNISRCISKSESNISSQTQCSKSEIPSSKIKINN